MKKHLALQEKNRRAQRRFRERQKQRLSELEEQVAGLEAELKAARAERGDGGEAEAMQQGAKQEVHASPRVRPWHVRGLAGAVVTSAWCPSRAQGAWPGDAAAQSRLALRCCRIALNSHRRTLDPQLFSAHPPCSSRPCVIRRRSPACPAATRTPCRQSPRTRRRSR
jgi:hypothetical protein